MCVCTFECHSNNFLCERMRQEKSGRYLSQRAYKSNRFIYDHKITENLKECFVYVLIQHTLALLDVGRHHHQTDAAVCVCVVCVMVCDDGM